MFVKNVKIWLLVVTATIDVTHIKKFENLMIITTDISPSF